MKHLARGDVVTALFFKDKPRPGVVVRASRYADSENLDYDAEKNEIHRNYNSWVQNLRGDINNELLKASR